MENVGFETSVMTAHGFLSNLMKYQWLYANALENILSSYTKWQMKMFTQGKNQLNLISWKYNDIQKKNFYNLILVCHKLYSAILKENITGVKNVIISNILWIFIFTYEALQDIKYMQLPLVINFGISLKTSEITKMGYFGTPFDSKTQDLKKNKSGTSNITHQALRITHHIFHMSFYVLLNSSDHNSVPPEKFIQTDPEVVC